MRAAILLILATTTTAAAAPNDELAVGPSTRSLRSSSANAVTDDDLAGGELTYARDLGDTFGIAILPRLSVWGVASYRWGEADGTMFQTLTTSIETDELSLGARARYELHRRVIASARLDLGTARTQLALEDAMGNRNADSHWAGTGSTAISLDLLAVTKRWLALGIRFELGYVTATAPEMKARSQEADDGTIMLPVNQVSFGHLDLGGRYFQFAWIGQF